MCLKKIKTAISWKTIKMLGCVKSVFLADEKSRGKIQLKSVKFYMDLFDLWVYGGPTKKFDFFLGNFEVSLRKLLLWGASINEAFKKIVFCFVDWFPPQNRSILCLDRDGLKIRKSI
jgi:hypothetical protein